MIQPSPRLHAPASARAVVAASALVLSAGLTLAQTVTWDAEAMDSLWFTGSNWNPDGVPGMGARVVASPATPILATGRSVEVDRIELAGAGLVFSNSSLRITGASMIEGLSTVGCCAVTMTADGGLQVAGVSQFQKLPIFRGIGPVDIGGRAHFAEGLRAENSSLEISGEATIGASTDAFASLAGLRTISGTVRLEPNASLEGESLGDSVAGWRLTGRLEHDGTGVPNSIATVQTSFDSFAGSTILARAGEIAMTAELSLSSEFVLEDDGVIRLIPTAEKDGDGMGPSTASGRGDLRIQGGGITINGLVSNLSATSENGLFLTGAIWVLEDGIVSNGKLTIGALQLSDLDGDSDSASALTIAGGEARSVSGFAVDSTLVLTGGRFTLAHGAAVGGSFQLKAGGTLEFSPGGRLIEGPSGGRLSIEGGSLVMPSTLGPTDRFDVDLFADLSGGLVLVEGGELRFRGGMIWNGAEINLGVGDAGSVQILGCCQDSVSIGTAGATGRGQLLLGGAFSTDRPDITLQGTLACDVGDADDSGSIGAFLNTRVLGQGQILNIGRLVLQTNARVEAILTNNGLVETAGSARLEGLAVNNGLWRQRNPFTVLGGAVTNTGVWEVSATGANTNDFSGSFTNTGMYRVAGPGPGRIGHTVNTQLDNVGVLAAENADVTINFSSQIDDNGVLSGGTWDAGPNSSIRFPGTVTALTGPQTRVRGNGASTPETAGVGRIADGAEMTIDGDTTLAGGPVEVENGRLAVEEGTTGVESLGTSDAGTVEIAPGARVESDGPVRVGEDPGQGPPSVLDAIGGVIVPARPGGRGAEPAPATVRASELELWGRILPGADGAVGAFRVEGPIVAHPTATWAIDLDPALGADAVHATGDVALDGTLRLTALAPLPEGAEFTVLSADGVIAGSFAAIQRVGPGATALRVTIGPAGVRAVVGCAADFDQNDVVNILDVIAFVTVWNGGGSVVGSGADYNADGAVNILDVIAFINDWQQGCA